MKFISNQGLELDYTETFNIVNRSLSPFKEILNKKDTSGFSIELEETISFENIFQLQVNVKQAGSFAFLFKKEGFNKEEAINEILPLKDMPSKSNEDIINKTKALFEVANKHFPLMVIYKPNGKYFLEADALKEISGDLLCFFAEHVDNEVEEANKDGKFKFENPFKLIAKEKMHFIFGIIAPFLITFTLSLAIYDIYAAKMIYIFFFICAAAGMFLNAFIYFDTIKAHRLKEMYTVLTIIFTLIGLGLGVGGYLVFKMLNKEPPKVLPSIMIIVLASLAAVVISAFCSLIIKAIKGKKKARK